MVRASSACVTPQHFLSAHGTNSCLQRPVNALRQRGAVTAVTKPLAGLGTVHVKKCRSIDRICYSSVSSKAAVLGRKEVNKGLSLSSGRTDEEKKTVFGNEFGRVNRTGNQRNNSDEG